MANDNEWDVADDGWETVDEGWEPIEAGITDPETYKVPFAELGNVVDKTATLIASYPAKMFGGEEKVDTLFKNMEDRIATRTQWANPNDKPISLGGQVAGAVATAIPQMINLGLQAPSTGMELIKLGESLETAGKGMAIAEAGAVIGMLPVIGPTFGKFGSRVLASGVMNAGQQTATDLAISTLAQGRAAQEAFAPTKEKAIVAGVVGAVGHTAARTGAILAKKQVTPSDTMKDRLIKAEMNLIERQAEAVHLEAKIQETKQLLNDQQAMILEEQIINQEQGSQGQLPLEPSLQRMAEEQTAPTGQPDLFAPVNAPVENVGTLLPSPQRPAIPTSQDTLPLVSSPEQIAAHQADLSKQGDLFVGKAAEQVANTQARLDKLLARQQELRREFSADEIKEQINLTYAKREQELAQQKLRESDVAYLQNHFKVPKGQRGVINMAIFSDENFYKIKLFNAKDGREYAVVIEGNGFGADVSVIDFVRNGELLSKATFVSTDLVPNEKSFAEVAYVTTMEKAKRKGLAEAMYKTMAELGNDIQTSKVLLTDGEAMWDAFAKKGLAQGTKGNYIIPRSQRGAIDVKEIEDGFKKLSEPVRITEPENTRGVSSTDIPADPLANSVIALGQEDKPYITANRFTSAGAMIESAKTGSSVIYHVGQIVQNISKRHEQFVRDVIYPIENKLNKFSGKEFVNSHAVFMSEHKVGMRYTPQELVEMGLSPKEVESHLAIRKALDKTLEIQNAVRASQNKKAITPEEAYYAASWEGAFGANISDKDGNIVWKLTADTRFDLNNQIKKLLKRFPELVHKDVKTLKDGKEVVIKKDFDRLTTRGMDKHSLDSAYTMMVDVLGRDNETVQAVKAFMEEYDTAEFRQVGKAEKHFIEKTGVRGFEGDKGEFLNPVRNAKQFYASQIKYMKNASRWAEIQKSSPNLSTILNSPELIASQPENMKYAREYVANFMGFGEYQTIRNLENWIGKKFGVSPTLANSVIGTTKGFWVTSKLMMSLGYSIANAYQIINITPHLADLSSKGFSGDPRATASYGALGGAILGLGHITTKGGFTEYINTSGKYLPDMMREAMTYAENNSVTNRSVYDESPIGSTQNIIWKTAKATVTAPETLARSIAFMSIVGHLGSSGKFSRNRWNEMFQLAEERTNMAMGDSRQFERSPVFGKAGMIGNAFNTLQTYPMNWFNQLNLFIREAGRGNPTPLAAMFLTQGAVAGAIGMPGIEDLHNLWEFIKNNMLSDESFVKVGHINLKTELIDWFGETGAYGVPSTASGYNMTSRLNAPTLRNTLVTPGGMVVDMWKTISDIGSAATHLTDPNKRAQAMLSASPPSLKEFVSQTLLQEYTQTKPDKNGNIGVFSKNKVGDYGRVQMYKRTPEEMSKAKWGIRTQKEVMISDVTYPLRVIDQELLARRTNVGNRIYSEMMTSKKINKDLVQLYINLGGKDLNSFLQSKAKQEFLDTLQRESIKAGGSVNAALNYKKALNLLKEAGYAQ